MEKKNLTILYASQTGNSESEAEFLQLQLTQAYNIQATFSSLDNYEIENLPYENYIIFLISTTGEGECCDNMKNFWDFLQIKTLPEDVQNDVKFSIFGFGDSKYEFYNSAARKLYQRMLQLGASTFMERAQGDEQDQGGYLNSYLKWKEQLFTEISKIWAKKDNTSEIKNDRQATQPTSLYEIKYDISKSSVVEQNFCQTDFLGFLKKSSSMLSGDYHVHSCRLQDKARETSEDHWQNVMFLSFDYEDNKISYEPGDIACIYPKNPENEVTKLLEYFQLEPDTILDMKLQEDFSYLSAIKGVPESITAHNLFSYILDIKKPPKFFFFKLLAFFTQPEDESSEYSAKTKLNEMGFDEYYDYVVKERRTMSEILFDFNSVKLPLETFIQFIGFIKPREYSIASSNKVHQGRFKLLVGSVEYQTPFGKDVKGVCSEFFEEMNVGDSCLFYFKKGIMKLPKDINDPIMLIGPGTGIAPFISFVEERAHDFKLAEKISKKEHISESYKNWVFFGNRNKEKDFLRGQFQEQYHQVGMINLFKAFSRDQEDKYYVQHILSDQAKRFAVLIKNNQDKIRIYVAGRAKYMPKGVERSLLQCIKLFNNDDEEKSEQIYKQLKANKQIIFETWD